MTLQNFSGHCAVILAVCFHLTCTIPALANQVTSLRKRAPDETNLIRNFPASWSNQESENLRLPAVLVR